jgi:hypothetical protein
MKTKNILPEGEVVDFASRLKDKKRNNALDKIQQRKAFFDKEEDNARGYVKCTGVLHGSTPFERKNFFNRLEQFYSDIDKAISDHPYKYADKVYLEGKFIPVGVGNGKGKNAYASYTITLAIKEKREAREELGVEKFRNLLLQEVSKYVDKVLGNVIKYIGD